MKFLDLISRKRSEDPSVDDTGYEDDPAPLEQVLAAVKAEDGPGDGDTDILDYPEDTPQAEDDAPRNFLDDDGSYDWDLSELGGEDVPSQSAAAAADETTDVTAALQDADQTGMEEEVEDLMENESWDGKWDDEAEDDVDQPETAEIMTSAAPAAPEDPQTAEDMSEGNPGMEMDGEAEAEADATMMDDDLFEPEAEDGEDAGASEDQAIESVAAALRAEAPDPAAAEPEVSEPKPASQQALLATIRAAREKAEQVRAASEAAGAAPMAAQDDAPHDPADLAAPSAPEAGRPEADWSDAPATASGDFDDDRSMAETPGTGSYLDDADPVEVDMDEGDEMAHETEFPDHGGGSARETTKVLDEYAGDDDVEGAADPVPAAPSRKIWDLDAGDDDTPAALDQADAQGDDDWADASGDADEAEAERETPRPERAHADPSVALAAMSAPKRRAGRVKTRLLGFNKPAQADPISQALEASTPEDPTFPVGWIVVLKGPGRGASFALGAGASTIGRGEDQAVRLDFGDNSISRDNHAVVAYDDEQRKFFLGHGGKANLVRLNDMPVLSTETIEDGDVIRIGETTLRFVALCGPEFSWVDEDAGSFPHAAAE